MRALSKTLCSGLALATALAWGAPAAAQRSFQAQGQVVFGSATIDPSNGTVVAVGTPQTVINWRPDVTYPAGQGNPAVFQPAGTTALFTTQPGSGLTDFAVLNRILVADNSRPVLLNGTILSRLQGDASRAAGTVYFYAPGGIIVGSNAVIDVGSLGLTTSDPWNGSGNWIGADRTVSFAASLPGRAITIQPGASLSSSGSAGSYTAIVAPTILHQGSIRTSGGAALVAADSATITFSPDNLYSIQVGAGDPGASGGLTVDGGSIGRAASDAGAANRRIYLVAIPKNVAMTMLIQGGADLGFAEAGAASVEGDAIVLSAGRDIARGSLAGNSNGLSGNAVIQNASFRDRTLIGINGSANLLAQSGDLGFARDLTVAAGTLTLRAENGRRIDVGGTLFADARQNGSPGIASFGGLIELIAGKAGDAGSGGTIAIGGDTSLLADGIGGSGGGNGVGGNVSLQAFGRGTIALGGALRASADGIGGAAAGGAYAGTGEGGSILLRTAAADAVLSVRGGASLSAAGIGGLGALAGWGAGGRIALAAERGSLSAGAVTAVSDGTGGDGTTSGAGRGGSASASAAGGRLTLASLALRSNGRGGTASAGDGGAGLGGTATLSASNGGTVALAGDAALEASASGGNGRSGGGAQDGRASLLADNGTLGIGGSATLHADASGGRGDGAGGDGTVGGSGGLLVRASQSGSLTAGAIIANAAARGGSGASAGRGLSAGGNVLALSNGAIRVGRLSFTVAAGGSSAGAVRDLLSIDSGSLDVDGALALASAGSLGVISNGGRVNAGSIALGARNFVAESAPAVSGTFTGGSWTVSSQGDVVIGGNLVSSGGLSIAAPGRLTLGNVSAAGPMALSGGGGVTLGNLATGGVSDLLVQAAGDLTTGDVASGGRVLLSSGGKLGAGNVGAGAALALLADGAIGVERIAAANGTVLIGDDGMTSLGGSLGSYDWTALLAATPVASRGSFNVGGTVSAARLNGAVGGDARFAGAVTGSEWLAFASGGLLSIDGAWNAPTIALSANDLALAGSLTASGELRISSTNTAGLQIGDGLSGGGFGLSDAEFARLKGGSIVLGGRSDASAAQAIQLGRLTLTGSQLGSGGTLRIASNAPTGRAGVIGILGQVSGSGLGASQTVELEAARVELDATRGGIALTGSGTAPGGQLVLRTDRLWAADPAILAKLNANANYTGRESDLAVPLASPRPEGLIRAGKVTLYDARQMLIQNSGTKAAPAGIATADGTFLTFASANAPIELIVNGQIIQPNGTATGGFAVQSALAKTGVSFTANSSVNGCLVSAASCAPPTVVTRDEDIHLGLLPTLPDKLFGDDDDGDGKKNKASAITPAEKLVDRKPIERVQPIDEPVSGAGNPAMIGGGATPGGGR